MTTVEIKISAIKSEIVTSKGNSKRTKKVYNENISYCIEHYVSAGQLVSLSLTSKGSADVYFQGLSRLKNLFVTEECFFGENLMILVKQPNLKTA
jgi:hypothetical protein